MRPRIVDIVYASRTVRPQSRHVVAVLAAVCVHVAVVAFAARAERGLGAWSANLALMVHDALAREDVVTFEPERPPQKEAAQHVTLSRAPKVSTHVAKSAAPAEAAPVLTQAPSEGPVDFPAFVSGAGQRFAGGVTAQDGSSSAPVTRLAAPDRTLPVRLENAEWSCPWPNQALSDIDEQAVVVKVLVREDGTVVDAKVVRDAPGGFGAAALLCAKKTQFLPARDRGGAVVRAWSPPIEVRFWR